MVIINNRFSKEYIKKFVVENKEDLEMIVEYLQSFDMPWVRDQEDWKVEVSVFFLFHIDPIPDRFFPILRKVLLEKWHHSHEDIVSLLELTASTENIEAVFEACFLECSYLKSYGRDVFVKKCVWALAKYDTQQAWEKIRMLESCSDDLVREATKRVLREMGKTQKKTRERFFCFG